MSAGRHQRLVLEIPTNSYLKMTNICQEITLLMRVSDTGPLMLTILLCEGEGACMIIKMHHVCKPILYNICGYFNKVAGILPILTTCCIFLPSNHYLMYQML